MSAAGAGQHRVGTAAAEQSVIVGGAVEAVIAVGSVKRIGGAPTEQRVIAVASVQAVGARIAENPVVAAT